MLQQAQAGYYGLDQTGPGEGESYGERFEKEDTFDFNALEDNENIQTSFLMNF